MSATAMVQVTILPAPESPEGGAGDGGATSNQATSDGGAGTSGAGGGHSGGGCGCRTGAPPTAPVHLAAIGVLTGLTLLRRRRRFES
jgi:MYXO-CTERM domain-containing protein